MLWVEPRNYLDEKSVVACCNCGIVPKEQGELFLKRAGWEGFSYAIQVKQSDGVSYRMERIGMCPACKAEPPQAKERKE